MVRLGRSKKAVAKAKAKARLVLSPAKLSARAKELIAQLTNKEAQPVKEVSMSMTMSMLHVHAYVCMCSLCAGFQQATKREHLAGPPMAGEGRVRSHPKQRADRRRTLHATSYILRHSISSTLRV